MPEYSKASLHVNSYYNFSKNVYFSKEVLGKIKLFCMFLHHMVSFCSQLLHQSTQNGRTT